MNVSLRAGGWEAEISPRGAELVSLKKDGKQLLWQGGPVWKDRCYNIFPFAGRLRGDRYRLFGKEYEMPLHGFVLSSETEGRKLSPARAAFGMTENPETLKRYPYRFRYTAEFSLDEKGLSVRYTAENRDEKTMYCAFGAHPGFSLPLARGAAFGDHVLEFASDDVAELPLGGSRLRTGERIPLGGRKFPLPPEGLCPARIFETDAGRATLTAGRERIELMFPSFRYLVLWSADPALVCVEPWGSVSERENGSEQLQDRKDMLAVERGESVSREWRIEA